MSLNSNFSGVVAPSTTKHDDDIAVKRQIQRRNVYKAGDKRIRSIDRNSLRVVDHSTLDQYDYTDGNFLAKSNPAHYVAKSAPGSGRSSPTDFLSFSLAAPKAWTPVGMSNPPIEAKVVILGAQGEHCCLYILLLWNVVAKISIISKFKCDHVVNLVPWLG